MREAHWAKAIVRNSIWQHKMTPFYYTNCSSFYELWLNISTLCTFAHFVPFSLLFYLSVFPPRFYLFFFFYSIFISLPVFILLFFARRTDALFITLFITLFFALFLTLSHSFLHYFQALSWLDFPLYITLLHSI